MKVACCRRITKPLIVAILPLLFLSTSVRLEMNSPGLYERGFDDYGISEATRIDATQLTATAKRLIGYFNSVYESPQMQLKTSDGSSLELFHDYELIHLGDVRRLFAFNSLLQALSLLAIVLLVLSAFTSDQPSRRRAALGGLQLGSALTLCLLALTGVAFMLDFSWMFVGFHLVAFDNPFWLLDPRTDYLVKLFPLGFWQDTFMLAGGITGLLALGTYGMTLLTTGDRFARTTD